MSQPYEIELVASGEDDYQVSLLATITGLPKDEIAGKLPEHLRELRSWRGQSFVEVARLLGYNCNPQFKPFDARTRWPCILRVQLPRAEPNWCSFIYSQGAVYCPWNGWVQWLDDFLRNEPEAQITSMLQIWIP